MSLIPSYVGSAATEKDILMVILAFITYYAILFLEAYVALCLFLRSTGKKLLKAYINIRNAVQVIMNSTV